ncbi:hypothetical protein LTR17_019035 [Elasticomyces elasticus]|nr:hypothetical protein LTR17_019035 [Elasticomyces elasticus]
MADSLTSAAEALWRTGKYSDLTIKCGDKQWAVHKAIVCMQSPFFAKACDGSFKEAKEGVITLEDDHPTVVKGMLQFMYNVDYLTGCMEWVHDSDCGRDIEYGECYCDGNGGNPSIRFQPLLFDVHIHIIADKYDLPGLAMLAVADFKMRAEVEWNTRTFAEAVFLVYGAATDRERDLRDIVVRAATQHAGELTSEWCDDEQAFCKVASTVPELGGALWKEAFEAKSEYARCPSRCGWVLPTKCLPEGLEAVSHCMKCGERFVGSQWRAAEVYRNGITEEEYQANRFSDCF